MQYIYKVHEPESNNRALSAAVTSPPAGLPCPLSYPHPLSLLNAFLTPLQRWPPRQIGTSTPHLILGVAPHDLGHDRGNVIERIPEEVLSEICVETEDRSSSFRSSVMRKCLKNLNVLTLSQVCRMWRFHIKNDASLWKDIAFDTSNTRSVKTAERFLAVIERTDTVFAVFADLHDDPYCAVGIFARLQPLTSRISHFEYFGALGACRQYLDRPAINLCHLSGPLDLDPNPVILSNPLFSGYTPRLSSLTMAAVTTCSGWATSLPSLTELELVPKHYGYGRMLPFKSLSNILQGVPNLRKLKLSGLGVIVGAKKTADRVTLPHLENLDLNQSDIHTVINYLEMPHLQNITFYGSDYPPGYYELAPVFQAPHFFSQISLTTIFKQEIAEVFLMAGEIGEDQRFWLRLRSSCGRWSLDIRMYWSRVRASGWKGYVERSIVALEKLVTLSSRAQVTLDFQPPFSQPLFIPFFHSPNVYYLTINGGFAEAYFRSLSLARIYYPLPRLRRFEIMDSLLVTTQVIHAIGFHLHERGIEFFACTSRGTLPPLDVFDVPDTGYIVFPYLLFLSGY